MEKRDGNWLSSGKGVCSRTGEEKLKNGIDLGLFEWDGKARWELA